MLTVLRNNNNSRREAGCAQRQQGVLQFSCFLQWMELALTLTLAHTKSTDDCLLMASLR